LKPESKLWQELKRKTPLISWTRLESWASLGVPDLLVILTIKVFLL